jgi:hypothetical protein
MEMECDGGRGSGGSVGGNGRPGGDLGRGVAVSRMSGRELRDFAAEQFRIAHDELAAFAAALSQHRAARAQIDRELERAWGELLRIVVPALEAPALPHTMARLGLPDLDLQGVARRSQARWAELAAALAELDRDPEVARAAEVGQGLEQRRLNLDRLLRPLGQALIRLESDPGFFELVKVGYGSPEHRAHLWQRRRYRRWRQALRIVGRHGERFGLDLTLGNRLGLGAAASFVRLYRRYLHENAAHQRLLQARTAVLARAAELAALARRRAEVEAELASLPEWALAFIRTRVHQQLGEMTEADRLARFAGDAAASVALQRLATLESYRRRLESAHAEHLDRPVAEAERALARLDGMLAELRPPSPRLAALHLRDEVERSYGLPLSRWREQRRHYHDRAAYVLETCRALPPLTAAAC